MVDIPPPATPADLGHPPAKPPPEKLKRSERWLVAAAFNVVLILLIAVGVTTLIVSRVDGRFDKVDAAIGANELGDATTDCRSGLTADLNAASAYVMEAIALGLVDYIEGDADAADVELLEDTAGNIRAAAEARLKFEADLDELQATGDVIELDELPAC